MNLDDWYIIFISACLILILIACAPLVKALLPVKNESFFTLAILGTDGMAEFYYPRNDPEIFIEEELKWTIYVNNNMGRINYIALRIKLLNSTMLAPNSTTYTPSSEPFLFETKQVLLNNETWFYPFSWSIKDIETTGELLSIKKIYFNNEEIDTNIVAKNGHDFRIIIELWVYNENYNDFQFSYGYRNELSCAWNQIWFNVNANKISE